MGGIFCGIDDPGQEGKMSTLSPRVHDLTGKTFSQLTVRRSAGISSHGDAQWECQCSCGKIVIVKANHIKDGSTKSCGCYRSARARKINVKHGKWLSRAFGVWTAMRKRCNDPKACNYCYYGAKGIKVCDRWLNSFENFYADMGDPPINSSIERINRDGNYEPGNCRWATAKEQANNRRNNVIITFNDKTQTLQQWADEYGINAGTLKYRINNGWPMERVLAQKSKRMKRK